MEKILNLGRKIIPKKLFKLGQPVYHWLLAVSGNLIYRFPGRKMIMIGITGTNGKSTTVELVNSVLKTAGYKTGMLSTIAFEVAGERTENTTNRTTLGRWQTQKMLRKMVKAGCEYCIMEVASEGIAQYRIWGVPFDVAVFTNLSPEHLNTHKTMTNYRNTKGKLFASLTLGGYKTKKIVGKKRIVSKVSIVNADDKEAGYFGAFPAGERYLYGIKKGEYRAKSIKEDKNLEFKIEYPGKQLEVKSNLMGQFNVYNLLAAYLVGLSQKVEPRVIKKGLWAVQQVKGRMEEIQTGKGFRIFVDYAMTPDSYEMLFAEAKKIAKGNLIAVFGAAGDRDRSKRPLIGEIAAKKTDYFILTDDEPYSEDPKQIIAEIETGVKKVSGVKYEVVADRKKAIKKAIQIAKKGDVIVIPGMGHQKYRNVGGSKKILWDEVEVIKSLLK